MVCGVKHSLHTLTWIHNQQYGVKNPQLYTHSYTLTQLPLSYLHIHHIYQRGTLRAF